jgi:hypothetical protein
VIVGGRYFDDVHPDEIEAGEAAENPLDFPRCPSARFGCPSCVALSECSRSRLWPAHFLVPCPGR